MSDLASVANTGVLAMFELERAGGTHDDLPGTQRNIAVAQSVGQLILDLDGEVATGFVAYLRMTPFDLLRVVEHRQRLFGVEENRPDGPVCFLMEQVNTAGREALLHRMRRLSALPGVECLAGWRGDRLRCHRVVR